MAAENDDFARIAISLGICTSAQIQHCLRIQSNTSEHLSLGQSLLREGFISSDQYSQVLTEQRKGGRKGPVAPATPVDPKTVLGAEDELLGRLLVREGWVTEEQVAACGRESLAPALVTRGFLDAARMKELQARLSKRRMTCRSCAVSFTVLSLTRSKAVNCPKCRAPLTEQILPGQKAENPIATQTFLKALSEAVRPDKKPPPAR